MDKNTLEQLLSTYNWWSGVSTIAVAVGILGEYVAHFIFEKEARENRLEMGVSILFGVLVLGGVVGEYQFGKRISQVAEHLQQIADTEVAAARRDAELARKESADTNERAAKTEREAAQLENEAAQDLRVTNVARQKAEEARQKAEGFSAQIADADERSAKANERAAHLEQRAAEAELELARIKAPRSLIRIPELVAALKPFTGIEYMFLSVSADDESIALLRQIDDVLQQSGWKRAQPSSPFPPAIAVWGRNANMAVTQALTTGLEISVESKESVPSLNAIPEDKRPALIKAAEALNAGLAWSLSPLQEDLGKTLRIESGDGKFVRIAVGRKPI